MVMAVVSKVLESMTSLKVRLIEPVCILMPNAIRRGSTVSCTATLAVRVAEGLGFPAVSVNAPAATLITVLFEVVPKLLASLKAVMSYWSIEMSRLVEEL